ncbi:hypothetical protein MAR621_03046 [Maribacter dokdonensis]|uniref:hypothetical protein n=1 Tax=Maribacter dokdonensis TaxID=320912 RepID=UPI001B051013|nr:hypothetical protein [Maribacter dokdonensis]CAG2532852.1 hypothetical protein MAR621_03046 [Maribacter dokdonensis]|tara:strand:+ start:378 stop:770 length:393 start_codon:yes stop_codon:yes gene_type:complete
MRIFRPTVFVIIVFALSSCEELLEVRDISGELMILLAPSDSTQVTENNVNFNWNEIVEATDYRVQVARPSFLEASQIVLDTLVAVDSTYIGPSLTKNLFDGSYEWRVKALNSDFETEFTTHSFTVSTSGN